MPAPYSPQVIEHFARPRNLGRLPEANGRGVAGDWSNGEFRIEIALQVEGVSDQAIITIARHRTFGCSATIAAASIATTLIAGRSVTEARELTAAVITAALGGLPPDRLYAPQLAVEAIQAALADWQRRTTDSVKEEGWHATTKTTPSE